MRNKVFLFLLLCFCCVTVLDGQKTKTTTISPTVLDRNGTGAIIIVTVPLLVLTLFMSIFGHRMRWGGVRFFALNLCFWGLVHMAYMAGFYDAERSPWPEWFKSEFWTEQKQFIETITRSIFPIGCCVLILERIVLTIVPFLEDNIIFNAIFGTLQLLVPNVIFLVFSLLQLDEKIVYCDEWAYPEPIVNNCWIYYPVELMGFGVFGVYTIVTSAYHVFCMFGCCCCCYSMANYARSQKTARTFVDMWLLDFYAQISAIFYYPSIGMALFTFATSKLMTKLMEWGLMDLIMGGGGGGGVPLPPGFDLATLMSMASMFIEAMPWFVTLFPLVQCVLTIVCFSMYREQFFYLISFGRMYNSNPEKVKRRNTFFTSGQVMIYPTQTTPLFVMQPSPVENVEKSPAPPTPPNPPKDST